MRAGLDVERELPDLIGDRTLAVAESCTGGALGARIVSVAGSSRYFLGGVIAYASNIKQEVLGVPESVLLGAGAVSQECALEMARGVRRLTGADLGVATTGIAGPGGATEQEPVGLVYVALVTPDSEVCTRNNWTGDRGQVIALSVGEGLRLLREYLAS